MKLFGKTINRLRLAIAEGEEIETKIAEAYMKGVNNTTKDLLTQITKMKNQISNLMNQNLEHEEQLTKQFEKQLKEHDNRFKKKCAECQLATDSERTYLRNLQQTLTTQMKKLDYMFSRVSQYLSSVKDYHDEIMLNAGRVTSTDYLVLELEKDFRQLTKFATPLLDTNAVEREFVQDATKKIE